MKTPKPAKPNPPLPPKQAEELIRIATSERPTTSSTPLAAPLSYWRLIRSVKPEGYPLWVVTDRGRAWLAADEAYRAARKLSPRKVQP